MSAWKRVGLRGRLALALAAVALLSVALATVLADSGLNSRLNQSARERLHAAAGHTAQLAAGLYAQQHDQWSAQTLAELGHLAGISGYRVAVYGQSSTQIKVAQRLLHVAITGQFGSATFTKVVAWQKGRVPITGVLDKATWRRLTGK